MHAQHRGRRALLAHPARDGDRIERGRVGVRPRVGRVDGAGERDERRLDPLRALRVSIREAGRDVALARTFGQPPGQLARLRDVGPHGRQPELAGERQVGRVEGADHLAAELQHAAVGQLELLDPAADAIARLEDLHVGTAGREIARGREARQPGAEDEDVGRHQFSAAMTCLSCVCSSIAKTDRSLP